MGAFNTTGSPVSVQDGTPINLIPQLTPEGVVFSYFDTSTKETEVNYHRYVINCILLMYNTLLSIF